MNLEKEIDKYYKEQAKLNEKSRKIIDSFNQKHSKQEVGGIVEFLLENSANTYDEDIKKFKVHYESTNKGDFSVDDIKIFITLQKVYNAQMKEPKKSTDEKNLKENTQAQDGKAEGKDE